MGFFLNTKGNLKEDANGRQPDENYAREVMQLFTIGLYELNPDGTLRLDANNQPIETYGQSDITNLARVFTGYDWDYLANGGTFTDVAWHDYDVPSTHFATNPMWFNPANHSNLAVTFPRHDHSREHAGPRGAAHRARPAVQPCEHRAVLRAADDPAPGDQQSVAGLRRPRGRGLRRTTAPACAAISRPCGPPFSRTPKRAPRRPRPTRCRASCASRWCASCNGRAPWAPRRPTATTRSTTCPAATSALGQSAAALAVGVQFLPARLRAAEHGHRHGRQAGAGIPAAERDHHRGLHQFHAVDDAQRLQRREADLRGAAADRARRAGGARLAQPAAHGQPAVGRDADACCRP